MSAWNDWNEEVGGTTGKILALIIAATVILIAAVIVVAITGFAVVYIGALVLSIRTLFVGWRKTSGREKAGAILLSILGMILIPILFAVSFSQNFADYRIYLWILLVLMLISAFISLGLVALAIWRSSLVSLTQRPFEGNPKRHNRCAQCGATNPVEYKFCGDCGTRLFEPVLKATNTCAQCGTTNPIGYKFCGKCGTVLAGPQYTTEQQYPARRIL